MLKRLAWHLGCIGLGLLAAGRLAAAADSSAPLWLRSERIPGTLRVNGVALEASLVTGASDPQNQLQALQSVWSRQARHPPIGTITRRGQWWLLDRFVDRWHETWQVRARDGGGCEGYVSRLDLRAKPAGVPVPPLRLPSGAVRRNVIESLDTQHRYVQWALTFAPVSVAGLRRDLLTAAAAAGWIATSQPQDWMLQWERAGESLQCQFVVAGAQRWMLLRLWRES